MAVSGTLFATATQAQPDVTMHFSWLSTGHSGAKSLTRTQKACLPKTTDSCDNVVVDYERTASGGGVPAPHGQGGPGYGINVSNWNDPTGNNSTSHVISGNCLTSTVTVHRKRRQRGWYSGLHTLFGQCADP